MKSKGKFMSLVLIATMAITPITIHADEPVSNQPTDQPQQTFGPALCVLAALAVAGAVIYIFNKKCAPKYYWLMDSDTPPRFWVGTATKKQCDIEGWKRIGGPYDSPDDAPVVHPPSTNRVHEIPGPVLTHSVERSTDGVNWTTIHQESSTQEDFGYMLHPTNQVGLFRLRVSP